MLLLLNNNNTAATMYFEGFPQRPGTFLSVWHTFKYLSSIKFMKQNTKGFGTTASKALCFQVLWFLCPITQWLEYRQRLRFKSKLCHSPTEWPRASSFSPLQTCFLISKMVKITLIHRVIVKAKWDQSHISLVVAAQGWQPHAMIPAAVQWPLNGHHIKVVPPTTDKQDFLYTGSSLSY